MNSERYGTKKKKGASGWIYFVLTVIFVLLMVKWGVPLFVNLVAGPTSTKGGLSGGEDNVPPQTPSLSALPEATNSAMVRIEGYTEKQVEVALLRNEELAATTQSDESGAFGFDLDLVDGENRIQVKANDGQGNESATVVKTIVYDKSEIVITIDSPADDAEVFGRSSQNLTISGKVNQAGANVMVNGSYSRVDSEGRFSAVIRLNEGDNNILVRATGRAGNVAEKTIPVKLTL